MKKLFQITEQCIEKTDTNFSYFWTQESTRGLGRWLENQLCQPSLADCYQIRTNIHIAARSFLVRAILCSFLVFSHNLPELCYDDLKSVTWGNRHLNTVVFKKKLLLLVYVLGQICFIRIKSDFSHADSSRFLSYIVLKKKKIMETRLHLHRNI